MIVAGLTGGIATGKSTVAEILRKAGAVIIDADRIARQVVAPGLPAWQEIRDRFGDNILQPDGGIDRAALGAIVFNDSELRRRLEDIIHPRVGAEIAAQMQRAAQEQPDAVVIMDIPLLFETSRTQGLAEIIVVFTPEPIQRQRLMARDQLSLEAAEARIRSQMPVAEKVRRATLTIDNSGSPAETERQTLAVLQRLTQRAREGHRKDPV
ncbi:MAG: dephospho-CoA kinase [Desulfobacterales bacterium]|nr:dephospho-CoA kinase [Desulfobacterales bacterium]